MAVEQQWPDVLAMVVADVGYRDSASGKYFILGTYSSIAVRVFPYVHPAMRVYLSLTNGHGDTVLSVRLIDVDESSTPVFETETRVNFRDPRDMIELGFVQPDVSFSEPGEYRLQLFGAGQFLRERRVWILPMQETEWEDA